MMACLWFELVQNWIDPTLKCPWVKVNMVIKECDCTVQLYSIDITIDMKWYDTTWIWYTYIYMIYNYEMIYMIWYDMIWYTCTCPAWNHSACKSFKPLGRQFSILSWPCTCCDVVEQCEHAPSTFSFRRFDMFWKLGVGYAVACLATRKWFWPPFRKTYCGITNPLFNLSVLKAFFLLWTNRSLRGAVSI